MIQLTELQITFIRKRLGVFLENIDFIEEMTDHFILDIERQLNEGIDVQTAFLATKVSFGGADGLQKLEKTFVKSFKKGIYNEMGQMYLQTLRKTPQNILLVLLFGCSYYLIAEKLMFWEMNLGSGIACSLFVVLGVWQTVVVWKYTDFQYRLQKNAIQVAQEALGPVTGIFILYSQLNVMVLKDHFDMFFLNILSTFVFCNFILWTYFSIKIFKRMQKNKIIISQ